MSDTLTATSREKTGSRASHKLPAEALGEGHDVRDDGAAIKIGVLVGEPFAGPTGAGLDLIEGQDEAVLVGEVSEPLQETGGRQADAAFPLGAGGAGGGAF